MEIAAYKKLALFYDHDWGDWCLQYLPIIKKLLISHCPPKTRILDLACGTGILVSQLALMGYPITGIDLSKEMIKIARSKNIPGAQFRVHDMTDFKTSEKFDLVTCTFDAINYLTSIEQLYGCFKSVADALNDDGIFLFDVNTEKLFIYYHSGVINREIYNQKFIQERSFNSETKKALTRFYFADGSIETHSQRSYDLNDLIEPAKISGFSFLYTYGDFNLEPYTSESLHCICVLKKTTDTKLG